ncbi:MAG: hypothetical protein RBS73_12155 [Prolixibacteraceae bacterium]|jgi:chemotaxis protein histidine kinase CheA|nr:hypothetical protein [Prolixibacteraceae bacterium]
MNYISEHKRGFIGTILVHGIILIILILYGFFTPLPLPGEEGILVNFGTDDAGQGIEEPAPQREQFAPAQQEEKPEPVTVTPPSKAAPKSTETKEEVVTQDLEKTAVIEQAKKKQEEEQARQEESDRLKKLQEQQKQAEIEKKRREEIARIEREKAEQRRREEAERKKREEEQRQISEINSRAKNVFGTSGQGDTDSKSTGQGVTYSGGNQGSPSGSANSDSYNKGGGIGNGPSYSLGGRSALALPLPYYPGNEEGVVVVQVTVDKSGNVTKAVSGARGSTTLLPELLNAAQKAALLAKFNVDANAPAFQQGTITYRFVLD